MTSITLSETYAHTRERVFAAFATADALAQWIAPSDSIPTTISAFDFSAEGRFGIAFDVGDEIHHLAGQFLTIHAPESLSFTWVWQAPAPHANVESHVMVSLKEVGPNTELTITHSRLDAPGMSDRHRVGWLGCLSRLHFALKESIR